MIGPFVAKYHLVRYAAWTGLVSLLVSGFTSLLWLVFKPPFWVLVVICLAFISVVPNPRWVRRDEVS